MAGADRQRTPIETSNLKLRPLEEGDGVFMAELLGGDRDAIRMTATIPLDCTTETATEWIKTRLAHQTEGSAQYTLTLQDEGGTVVGGCGLHQDPDDPETATIGYWIGRKYCGNGYATETVTALMDLGRFTDLHTMKAEVRADNPASIRVLEKLFFRLQHTTTEEDSERGGKYEVKHYAARL